MSEQNITIEVLRRGNDTALRLAAIMETWQKLRPDKVYYSMTIQQFKEQVKPYTDALQKLADLDAGWKHAQSELSAAEPNVKLLISGVVSAVKADREDGGENGPIYSAMGYTPISKRASGLVRRRKEEPPTGGSSTES